MKRPLRSAAAALIVLAGVLVWRTATFTSRQPIVAPAPPLALDLSAAARRLSEAIQHKTVSHSSLADSADGEFLRFREFLLRTFPRVHEALHWERVGDHSLLYTWTGERPGLKPFLLMAHMDVVPADPGTESAWTHPPFSGALAGGYIWGRGAMDDKGSLMAILEAAEVLLSEGFQPQRTIYLAFGHDEEIGGYRGAAQVAELLRARGIELEFVLDEGLNIMNGVISGVGAPVALVGIAEKGYLSLRLSVETAGGHSSIPPVRTAIEVLSRALYRLQAAPFPARLQSPTRDMLDFLGPEMAWPNRLALANLWLFEPLVKIKLASSHLTNAAIRTTLAPTIFNAGVEENILPSRAEAVINLRLLPGDSIRAATARVRQIINDDAVRVTSLPLPAEPSAVSAVRSSSFALLHRTIRQVVPEVLVAPALLVAATDSRHFAPLTESVFRFFPITLHAEDTQRYHGIDERISFEDYDRCIRFYAQLIRNAQAP